MRAETFVNVLNQGDVVWGFDVNHINDGFPVLVRTDLSVDSHAKKELIIYPNPTSGMVIIEGKEVAQVQVYNILGQVVRTFSSNRINVGDLREGIYLLQITDREGLTHSTKLVVE